MTLQTLLRRELRGDVLFDRPSRGRYSTDASIYQVEPVGVVIPQDLEDATRALEIATGAGVAVLPRGAGTSQCGQTVGEALIIDVSRRLTAVLEIDEHQRTAWVEPGVVLDQLNRQLKPSGLWFPVDVSTGAQATIGGMAGNNSCGARSIRYGNMVHNVLAIDAWLPTGETAVFEDVAPIGQAVAGPAQYRHLIDVLRGLHAAHEAEIGERVPDILRKVAGYNLHEVSSRGFNAARILVGSEGTLAFSRRIKLALAPRPEHKVLGVVHFPSFYDAMNAAQHIVTLAPVAVELVDRTMIGLSREIPAFLSTIQRVIRGNPDAVLLVEFAGDQLDVAQASLRQLGELMGDLGLPGSVVEVVDPQLQADIWQVRKAGLNIMMSMKGDGKPVSFIEDCAVPLEHLADYTQRLTEVFNRHGTSGTWYAHASVGCLHVRPVLDMRKEGDVGKMRAIAEEACAMVQEYKGAYSGEHGDGLVRSEWIERLYGPRLCDAFASIKSTIDPQGLMNPGKIVNPSRMDDRELFRYKPGYQTIPLKSALDWSEYEVGESNIGRGFAAAVEMCNNNGHCRKFDSGTMCPSFTATRNEKYLTRGRANSLRLVLSGQLGSDALTSDDLHDAMDLCLGCKGCRRECPTGVDMAKMKIEYLHQYHRHRPRRLRDRLVANLPVLARRLASVPLLGNLRDQVPGVAQLSEKLLGLSARRPLPRWHSDKFRGSSELAELLPERQGNARPKVALLPDTFSIYFEPENLRAAIRVLDAAGFAVEIPEVSANSRPLCCGRTYLSAGMIDRAREEAKRTTAALLPLLEEGTPIIGLEPSCLLTFRDELLSVMPGKPANRLATLAVTLEEFLLENSAALAPQLRSTPFTKALVHGHCHQKSFGLMESVTGVLKLVPGLEVEQLPSGCCGMAGAFGYSAEHYDVSMRIGEQVLLPAARAADERTVIVADGTSCRQQISDGAAREARHVVRVLDLALEDFS